MKKLGLMTIIFLATFIFISCDSQTTSSSVTTQATTLNTTQAVAQGRIFDPTWTGLTNQTIDTEADIIQKVTSYYDYFDNLTSLSTTPATISNPSLKTDFLSQASKYVYDGNAEEAASDVLNQTKWLLETVSSFTEDTEIVYNSTATSHKTYRVFIEGDELVIERITGQQGYVYRELHYFNMVNSKVLHEGWGYAYNITNSAMESFQYVSYLEDAHSYMMRTDNDISMSYLWNQADQTYTEYILRDQAHRSFRYENFNDHITLFKYDMNTAIETTGIFFYEADGRLSLNYQYSLESNTSFIFSDCVTMSGWTSFEIQDPSNYEDVTFYDGTAEVSGPDYVTLSEYGGGELIAYVVLPTAATENDIMFSGIDLVPAYTYQEFLSAQARFDTEFSNYLTNHDMDFTGETDPYQAIIDEFYSPYVDIPTLVAWYNSNMI